MINSFTNALGIKYPIIQAPLAGGGITTPQLVAEVSNAGALGSLGAGMMEPDAILRMIAEIRNQTDQPFNVNLFVLHEAEPDPRQIERALFWLKPLRHELGLREEAVAPTKFSQNFREQLAVVREAKPAIVSFTFGIPEEQIVAELHRDEVLVAGTATNIAEARAWANLGADFICAQGGEAGGHRGTFIGEFEDAMIGTLALTRKIVRTVDVPVIAAGGIMDGAGIAAILTLGAVAAQLGTAFLTCTEAGTPFGWKKMLLDAENERTVITRTFSGKPARGLINKYVELMQEHENEVPPYPIQNALTGEMRAVATKADRPEFLSLWAGQGIGMNRSKPAGELIREWAAEMKESLERIRNFIES